ncbi:MAG TPA: hypothetical protein VNG71_04010 [Pyrinomonadaceae bacterium]|nr:hypothetical protein [Pyrinomonadaceae bacterium]
MSELRRGDFVRFAAVQILRIKTGDDRLRVLFWNDVHRKSTLSALWRSRERSLTSGAFDPEVSALQD